MQWASDLTKQGLEKAMRAMSCIGAAFTSFLLATNVAFAEPISFDHWLKGFRAEAAAAGIRADIIDTALTGIVVNERVFELNDNQPEFTRGIWDYLDSAVSKTRISNGREQLASNLTLLSTVEEKYGVDREIIVAIWGLESAYGSVMGSYDAIQALATLAYTGRRTGYGRSQLIGAMKILQNGYASREQLKGSWAGAMGHTQFIPTTYLGYAVDHDGDGVRDLWGNLGDVFASTANYLSVSGYRENQGWGLEVKLPDDFNYSLADAQTATSLVEWYANVVTSPTGGSILIGNDPNTIAKLRAPAGANGPAFLTFKNFDAILKYNRSTSYALAVSLLSEEVAGRSGSVVGAWPRDDRPLTLDERKTLQQALTDRGFNPGPIDGIIGAGTRRALRAWQSSTGLPADGYASSAILEKLKS